MKENLTKSWTNNLGMKLFSLPLAFIIWIIIINIDDPTISRNFLNVPVELLNSDALDTLGKVYEIAEGKKKQKQNTADHTIAVFVKCQKERNQREYGSEHSDSE